MLSPYRVLDLTNERGLICGQILADLGADVIAVEPPGGSRARRLGPFADGVEHPEGSLLWWAYNRGKRSAVVDIRSVQGQAELRRLAADADVLIESEDPGVMGSLGLGYTDLAPLNPGLVYVSISAFGQDGPKAKWAATDLTIWASAGTMPTIGDPDRPPLRLSVPQSWLHAGAVGAIGALVALHERATSGRGQYVDISAQQAVALTTMSMILNVAWNTPQAQRGMSAGGRFKNLYRAKDGWAVLGNTFGAQAAQRSRALMQLVYDEGFCDEASRDTDWATFLIDMNNGTLSDAAIERLVESIEKFMSAHTKEELFLIALEHNLWMAPVRNAADVAASKQLEARHYWQALESPAGGSFKGPGPFVQFGTRSTKAPAKLARVGEHTEEVLQEPGRQHTAPPATEVRGKLPLEGLKVLDFSWVMAAPAAVRVLADWGATIVHIESSKRLDLARTSIVHMNGIAGVDSSGWWQNLAMGKKSVTLDLSSPEAREIVFGLTRWADLVVESYSPGQMAKWGLGPEVLRAVNPKMTMLSSSLLGQSGPHYRYSALGTQASPLMGFWDLTGWPDRPPSSPTGAYTDLVAPWFTACTLLAALDHRRRTGEDMYIDFAQSEAALQFIAPAILDHTVNGHLWTRRGNDDFEMAPHGAYPAKGEPGWVAISCRDDDDWRRLCSAMGQPQLAEDPAFATTSARLERREALDKVLSEWTAAHEATEMQELLQSVGVPAHRVQNSRECLEDPQLLHREHFVSVPHPIHGPVTIEGSRIKLSRTRDAANRPGPLMGEHNAEVLRDILGYDDEKIGDLVAAGVLE